MATSSCRSKRPRHLNDSEIVNSVIRRTSTPSARRHQGHSSVVRTALSNRDDPNYSLTDLDDTSSWRSDTTATSFSSSTGIYSEQDMHEKVNSQMRTIENLSQAVVTKDRTICKLEAEIAAMAKENAELRQRFSVTKTSKTTIKDLSGIIKEIYGSISDADTFDLDAGFSSSHNQNVKSRITNIIKEDHVTYSPTQINDHIRQKYTNDRRRKKEKARDDGGEVERKRKITARRYSSYESRKRIANKKTMHMTIIHSLGPYDMSDLESDCEDSFVVKKPSWRTPEVENAINELDSFAPLQRKRSVGSPSKRKCQ